MPIRHGGDAKDVAYIFFDRKSGEQVPYQAPAGVAPPENMGGYANQRISGISNKFDDLQSKFKKAVSFATPVSNQTAQSSGFDFSENPH